jgi:hypothetical protein
VTPVNKGKDMNISEGLKRIRRIRDKSDKRAEESRKKFAIRQAVRSAMKYGSGQVVGRNPKGMKETLPSYYAIGQQFGADVAKNTKGEIKSTPYSPTEDMAFTGRPRQDKETTELFKKIFLDTLKKRKVLPG